jgi:hypothetical protein
MLRDVLAERRLGIGHLCAPNLRVPATGLEHG